MQTVGIRKSGGATTASYLLAASVLLTAASALAGVRTVSAAIDSADRLVVTLGEATGTTNTLFMAYGAESGGDTPSGWEKIVRVGVVAADETSLVVAPPAGWESTVRAVRFFAVDGALDGDLPVEYIAGEDANVSFPLNYVPTSDTRTQIKFMYTHHNGSTFFGTQYGTAEDNDYRFFQGADNATAYFDVGSARINSSNVLTEPTAVRHFELGNHYIKDLDTNSDIVRAESAVDLTSYATALQLFAGGDYGRVYSLKIYEGETLVLDLEPYVKADGTPAFRDSLTGSFYEATGAGVVSAGKPMVLLDGETQKQMSAVVADAASAAPVPGDYAKRLRVTPDAVAVTGSTTFSDVPVLLRLSTAITGFDYADFTRGGKDMLILDEEGTALPYEIETWNPAGESLVWVKVPTLSAHTQLMAYYGDKQGRRNGANDPTQVWSAYAGVWHMDEQQAAGSCADSSPNAYHTQNQENNTGAAGFLGGARDATSGGMIVPGTTAMNLGPSFTVMGFVTRTSKSSNWDHLFYKKNASGDWGGWCVEMYGQSGEYGRMSVLGRESRKSNDNITHGISDVDTWYHILITYDNLTARLYNNGVAMGSGSFAYASTWTGENIRNLAFGCASNGSSSGWKGLFDEFRICSGAMSAERAALEYALMQSDAVSFDVFDNDVDPLALGDCSLVSNGDGTYAATAVLSSGSATSVKVVLSNGAEFELAPSGATAPVALNGTISGLTANLSFVADVVATSAGGDIAAKQISGTFYNGSVSVAKTVDALEETLEPGAFVFSRAEGAGATEFDLVVHYTVGGTATAGSDYKALSGEATIPAGESSVMVLVEPLKNVWTDVDVTVSATITSGSYHQSAAMAVVTVVNTREAALQGFTKRTTIALSYDRDETLEGFPVLVRLSETPGVFSYADAVGANNGGMAFFDEVGNLLPYEIDTWNPSGESLVWVRTARLLRGSVLYLCYGGEKTVANNPSDVWTGYVGVWHMNETGTGAGVAIADSTVHQLHGTTPTNADAIDADGNCGVTGKIGGARRLSTKGGPAELGRILVPNNENQDLYTDRTVTMSIWVLLPGSENWGYLMDRKARDDWDTWGLQFGGASDVTKMRFRSEGSAYNEYSYGSVLSKGDWHHVVAIWDRGYNSLYIDGVELYRRTSGGWMQANQTGRNLAIGGLVNDNGTSATWGVLTGDVDEARMTGIARSSDWCLTEYETVTNGFSMLVSTTALNASLPAVGSAALETLGGKDVVAIPLLAGSGTVYAILRDVATGVVTTNAVSDGVVSADVYYLPVSSLPENRYFDVATYVEGVGGVHDSRTYSIRVRNAREKKLSLRASGYTGNTVENFPALVRLSESTPGFGYDLLCDKTSGSDIHFQDESGNELQFDCDTWNTEGESLFWVKMPVLRRGAKIFLLYGVEHAGNTDANRAAVWSGQTGVWHMLYNSTSENLCGNSATENIDTLRTWNNGTIGSAEGIVGEARRISTGGTGGTGNNAVVVSNNDLLDLGSNFTVSTWLKYPEGQNPGWDRVISRKSAYNSNDGWEITLSSGNPSDLDVRGGSQNPTGGAGFFSSPVNDGEWHYVTAIYSDDTVYLYENGVYRLDVTISAAKDNNLDLSFGNNSNKNEIPFKGMLDEIRIGAGSLSADRIKADYETVANADFFTAGVYKPGFFVIVR